MATIELDPTPMVCDTHCANDLCIGDHIPSKACCGCGGPCCTCGHLTTGDGGVDLQLGNPSLVFTDVVSPFYSAVRRLMPQSCRNFDLGSGNSWLGWPILSKMVYEGVEYLVAVLEGGDQHWFLEEGGVGGEGEGGGGMGGGGGTSFTGKFGTHAMLAHDDTNGEYTMCMENGSKIIFQDFDQGAKAGVFKKSESAGGDAISVDSYDEGRIEDIQRSVTVGMTTTIQSMSYNYDSNDRVDRITYRTKEGMGSWDEHRRTLFTYYGASESHGTEGDLKTAKQQIPSGASWATTHTTYYRYYKDGDADGRQHLIKYVVGPEAYQRLDDAVADPLTATDAQVADKADLFMKYDPLSRVTQMDMNAGNLTYTYSYGMVHHSVGANSWKFEAIETRPDGTKNKRYMNHIGQVMASETIDGSNSHLETCEYNTDFNPTEHAHPSAVTSIDDRHADLYFTHKTSDGKIDLITYYTNSIGGAVEGEPEYLKTKNGSSGTEIKLKKFEYATQTVGDCSVHPISKETSYRDVNGTDAIETSIAYQWFTGKLQMEERKTTLPSISAAQHGSGSSNERYERFDSDGRLIWIKDERGFISRRKYDDITGAMTQSIDDVDTTVTTDEPSGWSTPSGGGKHLVSDYEIDDLGRVTQSLGPEHEVDISGTATDVRSASWMIYQDEDHEHWSAEGYATGVSWDTYTLVNPVSIQKTDRAGRSIESITATRASTSGKLLASDSFAQTSYVRWSTSSYNDESQLEHSRVYHTIPSSGAGSSGTNYDQTDFGYAASGQQNKTKSPGGTISRNVFDGMGRVIKSYVGLDDTSATDSDPTGGGASGNDMVIVSESEFDSGNDGGDGYLTKSTSHVDSSTKRDTTFGYDWRGRRTSVDGEEEQYVEYTFDNLDQVTQVDQKDTTSSGNLVGRSESEYDDLGRVYQSKRYAVDKSTGTVGDALISRTWFNESGAVIKQQAAGSEQFTKFEYDSLGRQIKQFVGFDTSESTYAEVDDVSGDTIFEQSESDYDDASNVIETRTRQRHHDATGTGELTTPSGSNPKARVSYVAHYADAVGRSIAVANYGTNADTALTRSSTVPASSDTILVSGTEFNDDGEAFKSTDPAGKEDRVEFDDAGRVTKQIENYTDGNPTTGGADEDVTVEFTYNADGQRATIVAKQQTASDDQTTTYVYGSTLTESDIARSDLLRAVIYPDSDDVASPLGDGADTIRDRMEFTYNRTLQHTSVQTPNQSVHSYDFDLLGRQIHDRVTTLGTGVHGAVRRLSFTYNERGQLKTATSYDNASVGSGTVVNEILREYNDMSLLDKEYQEHEGAKDANTLYVGYNYDETAASSEFTKGWRLKSMRYPNSRLVHYTYGSSASDADNLNRLDAIKDDSSGSPGSVLASYDYLGMSRIVIEDYEEPDIKLDYFGGTSGTYAGFDRFGRVVDQRWVDYGSSTDVVRHKFGHDRTSNPIWMEDTVLSDKDEYFTYDGVNRLENWDRGTLNVGKTAISGTPKKEEDWTLDPLGNWMDFVQKSDGTTDLDQSRTHNKANEITGFTETTGPSWVDPAQDRNGNMTTIPRPADPTGSLTLKYDPWNRMVEAKDGSTVIGVYEYDAMMRRVKRHFDSDAPDNPNGIDTYEHVFFSSQWQDLETRETSTESDQPENLQPKYQWIWSNWYMDGVAIRDKNLDSDGLCDDERIYFLRSQSKQSSSLAFTDDSGSVLERFKYSAYGVSAFLTPQGGPLSNSSYDASKLSAGMQRDNPTGLYLNHYRWYDSSLGRFLARDPVGYQAGLNLYGYCDDNPIECRDHFGLSPGNEHLIFTVLGGSARDLGLPLDRDVRLISVRRRSNNQFYDEWHHWFPRELAGRIASLCPGLNIDRFLTQVNGGANHRGPVGTEIHASEHYFIHHILKYNPLVLASATSCCELVTKVTALAPSIFALLSAWGRTRTFGTYSRSSPGKGRQGPMSVQNTTAEFFGLPAKYCVCRPHAPRVPVYVPVPVSSPDTIGLPPLPNLDGLHVNPGTGKVAAGTALGALGGTMVTIGATGSAIIIADDLTVIGVADNVLLIGTGGLLVAGGIILAVDGIVNH